MLLIHTAQPRPAVAIALALLARETWRLFARGLSGSLRAVLR